MVWDSTHPNKQNQLYFFGFCFTSLGLIAPVYNVGVTLLYLLRALQLHRIIIVHRILDAYKRVYLYNYMAICGNKMFHCLLSR